MTMSGIALAAMKDSALEAKLDDLLARLTLEEKASLTSGRDNWSTQPIERLGIPSIWMADGPHGLRRAPTSDTWGYGDQLPATCFPTASALAASWDRDLVLEVGAALGTEAQALGVNVLLGPGTNIKRSVLGGRNFEYFSEDPFLSGQLSAAYINGVQSRGVGTSLKHYVANNVETARMWVNSALDDRTLNEIYLTPFEIAVKNAQPWTIMACYNRVQGEYGTQSAALLTRTLKEDWGFEGIVVSDWESVIDRVKALDAGMHLEMPGHATRLTNRQVVEAVRSGALDQALLDKIVKDILRIVLRASESAKKKDQALDAHHQLARKVAGEGIVLLKNQGGLLPLSPDKVRKIAVLGEFATSPRYQGNGSSEVAPPAVDGFLDILREEYGDAVTINQAPGYSLEDDEDTSQVAEAARLAAAADVALLLVGLPQHYESEGVDRTHIELPPVHNALVDAVVASQPNTVVVLTNGSAVAMPWVEQVPTIVEGWLGGQAGAGAVADVLFGKVNPSGKLAETFPVRLEDTPAFLNFPGENGEVLYGERIYVGYRWYDARQIEPLFPFGHGLSYTQFEYSDLEISSQRISDRDVLNVSVEITNTGDLAGKEVVQLYLSDPVASLQRPPRELKGFAKVELASGQGRRVSFELSERDFAFYHDRYEDWIAESGDFEILVGASSRDIRLSKTVELESTRRIHYRVDEYSFLSEFWNNPELQPLVIELMPKWLGLFKGKSKSLADAKIPHFLVEQPLVKFPAFTGGEVTSAAIADLIQRANQLTFTP
jgi:beta-glucosidase